MSIALMNEVWDADLDAKSKLILLSLADNANDAGICWPTQATIARRASLSERSVRDYLHRLADEGLITVLELGNGRGLSTKYRLNLEAIKAAKAAETEQKAAETDVKAEDTCRPITISQPPDLQPSSSAARAREVSPEARRALRAVEDLLGSLNKTIADAVLEFCDEHVGDPGEWVSAACEEAALANARNWKYVAAILGRWRREGFKAQRGSSGTSFRTNGGGRGIRSGNGASERRPESTGGGGDRPLTDAEAEQERIRRRERSEAIRAARAAAGKVV